MAYKHKRKILRNPEELEISEKKIELLTSAYMRGEITREKYEKELEELNLYLDLRQLAVELQVA